MLFSELFCSDDNPATGGSVQSSKLHGRKVARMLLDPASGPHNRGPLCPFLLGPLTQSDVRVSSSMICEQWQSSILSLMFG